MMRLVREHATHLLGASQEACNDLFGAEATARGLPQVVHNAVDPGRFRSLPADKFLLRRQLGLDGGGVLVGHVGRFEEVKNHDFLLRSFAALSRRFPDVRLVLAGDGPLRTRVMRQASATGLRDRVDFLGVVPHIPRLLAALDLFLFPSRWEGLGLALVEAQAAGIPCLVSDRVPREADIGLGLTVFRSLEDGPAAWADASAGLIGALPPLWPDRLKALRAGGYDIDSLARALSLVYSGAVPAVRI
jgi:glycosyltransferase involved in cell wall biosynthesis